MRNRTSKGQHFWNVRHINRAPLEIGSDEERGWNPNFCNTEGNQRK